MIKLPTLRQAADLSLIACTLTIVALLVKRELFGTSASQTGSQQPSRVENWREYDVGGWLLAQGDSTAIHIVEFSDFQCPYCAMMHSALDSVIAQMPGQVTVRFRHFPLVEIHPFALPAAVAAECAGQQAMFKQFHDGLFADRSQIGITPWVSFARRAGVRDTTTFLACMSDSTARLRVTSDIQAGIALQLKGTPALLVEGQLLPGALSAPVLEAIARRARH